MAVAQQAEAPIKATKSIIGAYGSWAAGLASDPPALSIRNGLSKGIEAWHAEGRAKALECIAPPDIGTTPKVTVNRTFEFDGLRVEELSWQLPYGRSTQAILLKPKNAQGRLPAILGLHDHGGNKYFGKRKITRTSDELHPHMVTHQADYYSGRAWANEIAKRGYAVLVHDAFAFASRRVLFEDMSEIPWGPSSTRGMSDRDPESPSSIKAYNQWAAAHEHVMAKSLFCAGTTWPGVFLAEDQRALDVLASRSDVDAEKIGCAGLSGGGLRTVYLGGLDPRIRCAVCVGFMSTWDDFLLNKSYAHTWMTYAPILPNYLDFPEILGLRAPLPTMTLNNNEDQLFTVSEMKKADRILKEVFQKAGARDNYRGGFYPGKHKFDAAMQEDAFNWFDRWLKQ
ncbi:MAG: hypothetical protein D6753_02050 [Planctomycetota bacterium]|nr:MAG: hypothetical protein D6753_02050 [Planctomycetota bacterium]